MMRCGFYYAVADTGQNFWRDVRSWRKVNVYMDWELGKRLPQLPGRRLWIDLGMYTKDTQTADHVRAVVKALRPSWRKIIALELGDEFKGTAAQLSARARMVRHVIAEAGLSCPPLFVTQKPEQITGGGPWQKATGIDGLGIEAYLEAIPGEDPFASAARMDDRIRYQLGCIGSDYEVILIGQAYRMSQSWKQAVNLVAIQDPIFKWAKKLDAEGRLTMLAIFAWAKSFERTTLGECAKEIPLLAADLKARLT